MQTKVGNTIKYTIGNRVTWVAKTLYSKIPLSLKIIVPFLGVSLSLLLLVTYTVRFGFFNNLEQRLVEEVDNQAALVVREFSDRSQYLLAQAKLIGETKAIARAIEQKDTNNLKQNLLPFKTILRLDLIKVVDARGATIVQLGNAFSAGVLLRNEAILARLKQGLEKSDLVGIKGRNQAILVGFAPIKYNNTIVGGVIIGSRFTNEQWQQFSFDDRESNYFAIFKFGQMIATNLPQISAASWQPPPPNPHPTRLTIQRRDYLAKTVALSDISHGALTAILHSTAALDRTELLISQRLDSFFWWGAIISIIVGGWVAKFIAQPIINLTRNVRWIANGDFTTKVPVTCGDEVGELAEAFNFMVDKLANREQKLNERLHQLQQALHDLKQAQSQLIQAEKMSSLGVMIAGIAHEINNPVNFISGNIRYASGYTQNLFDLVDLYQQYYPKPASSIVDYLDAIDWEFLRDDLPKLLSSMEMGATRIQAIIRSLRNFSRLDEAEIKLVDLHEGIDSTLLILNNRIKNGITVIKLYGNLPLVECYPAQLNQVFMNIISNGIDALDECEAQLDKQITIRTKTIGLNQVLVEIQDNGSGINPSVINKLFDPFFTTKAVGKGTGLGLSIAYQIIEKHGGKISVTSILGQGTQFAIALPVKHEKTAAISRT